jgi:hypothetical protein
MAMKKKGWYVYTGDDGRNYSIQTFEYLAEAAGLKRLTKENNCGGLPPGFNVRYVWAKETEPGLGHTKRLNRQGKTSFKLIEWLLNTMHPNTPAEALAFELGCLVTYFKIAALLDVDKEPIYVILRQHLPSAFEHYDQIFAKA